MDQKKRKRLIREKISLLVCESLKVGICGNEEKPNCESSCGLGAKCKSVAMILEKSNPVIDEIIGFIDNLNK